MQQIEEPFFDEKKVTPEQLEAVVEEAQKPAEIIASPKAEWNLSETGLMKLDSISQQKAFAQQLMAQGVISKTFKTVEQIIIAMQYCAALSLPAVKGLKMMYVINGQPALYGDGPLMLAKSSGLVADMKEFFIDEDGEEICFANKNLKKKVWGCVTRMKRKGEDTWQEDSFTLHDLEVAQLDKTVVWKNGKPTDEFKKKDVWEKFERNMMRYKARTLCLKSKFADVINGVPIAEHDFHFTPEAKEVNVLADNTKANIINETYGEQNAQQS